MRIPSVGVKRRARIEIIPLIDIVFFLLATFVMVSLSMVKNQGIPVNLPGAASAVKEDRAPQQTTISVTKEGVIYFDKERIERGEVTKRLKKLASGDPKVFIQGDEEASFGTAIYVLDEARKLGIKKISIRTKPVSG